MKVKVLSFLFNTCHQQQMMIIIICTSCTSIHRKEKCKMNTHFFLVLFTIHDDAHRLLHVFIYVPQADEMKWTCIYMQERRRERVQLSHTYKRPSSVCLSRHVSYSSSKGKEGEEFFFFLSYFSFSRWMFLFSSHIHSIISHAVMVRMFLTISISSNYFNDLL